MGSHHCLSLAIHVQQARVQHFCFFDKGRLKAALETPTDRIGLSVGPLTFVGSILYVWACAAWTHEAYWLGRWANSVQHVLVNIPFLVCYP